MLKQFVISIGMLLSAGALSAMGINDTPVTEAADSVRKVAEPMSRNLFVEFGGPGYSVASLGYDQRFRPGTAFGFRAGFSIISGSGDNGGWFGAPYEGDVYRYVEFKGVTLPLEVNAIMGNRASKFELGLGVTPCILDRHYRKYYEAYDKPTIVKETNGVRLNVFWTFNVGYRLQRKSGFFLRTGLTFGGGDIKFSPFDGTLLIPYLSLGYTIK